MEAGQAPVLGTQWIKSTDAGPAWSTRPYSRGRMTPESGLIFRSCRPETLSGDCPAYPAAHAQSLARLAGGCAPASVGGAMEGAEALPRRGPERAQRSRAAGADDR